MALTPRALRLSARVVAGLAVGLVFLVGVASPASAAPRSVHLTNVNYADPGLVWTSHGYYALYGTGPGFKVATSTSINGHFQPAGDSLRVSDLPSWVGVNPSWGGRRLWAPSVTRVGSTYVMYYTAWNGSRGRQCIGIATSTNPLGYFRPVGTPICAPSGEPAAAEAIDPSAYVAKDGACYMVFKTSVTNTSRWKIWAKPMGKNCRTFGGTAKVKINGTYGVEAPSVVRHGGHVWLFVSRHDYSTCGYNVQVWRTSTLWTGTFSSGSTRALLNQRTTGRCGPGGATVVQGPSGTRIAFHAWDTAHPATDARPTTSTRSTYTAIIDWGSDGWPHVR